MISRVNRCVRSTICACGVLSSLFVQHPRHINSPKAEPIVGNLLTKHIPAELPFARGEYDGRGFRGLPPVCTRSRSTGQTPPYPAHAIMSCLGSSERLCRLHVTGEVLRLKAGASTILLPHKVQAGGLQRPTSDWAQLKLCNQIIPSQLMFALGIWDVMSFFILRICVQFCF